MIEARDRTAAEIDSELADARAALLAAEQAEQAASDRVTAGREAFSLDQLAKRALGALRVGLADHQEALEQARWKVRAYERLQVQQAEAEARAQASDRAARSRAVQAEDQAIQRDIALLIARFRADIAAVTERVALHNRGDRSLVMLSSLRGPTDYEGAWGQVDAGLARLARNYPDVDVRAIRTNPINEE